MAINEGQSIMRGSIDYNERPIVTGTTTFATFRHDLKGMQEQPTIEEDLTQYEIDWDTEEFFCWQPEELDNFYLNLILWCPKRNIMFRSNSIDWDFNHVPQHIIDEAANENNN